MQSITPSSLAPSGTRVDLWLKPARAERYDPQSSTAFWGPIDGRPSGVRVLSTVLVWAYTRGLCRVLEVEHLQPPATFELHALDERSLDEEPAPRPLTDYEPFDIEEDAERFGRVDAHARQVASRRFATLRELLYALVFRRGLDDDFERVRYSLSVERFHEHRYS